MLFVFIFCKWFPRQKSDNSLELQQGGTYCAMFCCTFSLQTAPAESKCEFITGEKSILHVEKSYRLQYPLDDCPYTEGDVDKACIYSI